MISVPVKGQKLLLRGFDPAQETEAGRLLSSRGYELVSSIALADTLVVGPGNAKPAVEAAQKARITVTPWNEFRSGLGDLDVAATPSSVPALSAVEVGESHPADVAVRAPGDVQWPPRTWPSVPPGSVACSRDPQLVDTLPVRGCAGQGFTWPDRGVSSPPCHGRG